MMADRVRYACDGYRSVIRDRNDHDDFNAAEHFAEIAARRAYGRSAVVGPIRCDSWTQDGSATTYEAFIGRRGYGCINGHNIWLTVCVEHI